VKAGSVPSGSRYPGWGFSTNPSPSFPSILFDITVFQRGDSGTEVRSLTCPRMGTDRAALRQSPPTRRENAYDPSHRELPPTTTSDFNVKSPSKLDDRQGEESDSTI